MYLRGYGTAGLSFAAGTVEIGHDRAVCGDDSATAEPSQHCTAALIEVFAGLFQKAAGSQGRALRRGSQAAKLPF